MMTRRELVRRVQARLGKRKLVWFGTRGEDVQALLDLPQFSEVFSLIAPFGSVSMKVDVCLEQLSGRRLDLDTYDIDQDKSAEARELRRTLFRSLGEPAVVVPYRPLAFLSSVQYPRSEYIEYLGLFHERQAPFEHKPWVESELKRLGVPVVPWRYFTDDDRMRVQEQVDAIGAVVLRTNRSDGGVGLKLVRTAEELVEAWQPLPDGFLAAAPFLTPHTPLNINVCVFFDGSVTLHTPSLQLLGISGCTGRSFGYCGNDFGAVLEQIEPRHLDDLEEITVRAGQWLADKGYLGAFGVDAMVHDGSVYLVEINPRFQGSSALSAKIDCEQDRPDIFLCHLAAFLGISLGWQPSLRDIVGAQPRFAQIICHNAADTPLHSRWGAGMTHDEFTYSLVPPRTVTVDPEAILFRAWTHRPVTQNGFSVDEISRSLIEHRLATCFEKTEDGKNGRTGNHAGTEEAQVGRSRDRSDNRRSDPERRLHTLPGGGRIEFETSGTESQ